ncbi:hypothetical protein ACTA71_000713 [Dictyostelium dimigraforme]
MQSTKAGGSQQKRATINNQQTSKNRQQLSKILDSIEKGSKDSKDDDLDSIELEQIINGLININKTNCKLEAVSKENKELKIELNNEELKAKEKKIGVTIHWGLWNGESLVGYSEEHHSQCSSCIRYNAFSISLTRYSTTGMMTTMMSSIHFNEHDVKSRLHYLITNVFSGIGERRDPLSRVASLLKIIQRYSFQIISTDRECSYYRFNRYLQKNYSQV